MSSTVPGPNYFCSARKRVSLGVPESRFLVNKTRDSTEVWTEGGAGWTYDCRVDNRSGLRYIDGGPPKVWREGQRVRCDGTGIVRRRWTRTGVGQNGVGRGEVQRPWENSSDKTKTWKKGSKTWAFLRVQDRNGSRRDSTQCLDS